MSRPYIHTADADKDIDRLYEDGIRKHGRAPADSYVLGLDRILQLIADNPRMARETHEITPPVRLHAYRTHVLIYYLNEEERPVILAVKHGSEPWLEHAYSSYPAKPHSS